MPEIDPLTLELLGTDFVEDVQRFVVPIFRGDDREAESIGTGFLLGAGGKYFLVTAAHVLDDLKSGIRHYFFVEPTTTREVSGQALIAKLPASGERDDDTIDVGVVELEGEGLPPYPAVGREALSASRVAQWQSPRHGKKYAFLGFPSSKGEVNPMKREIRSASYAYLGTSPAPDDYERMGLSEASHILLPFDKKNVITLQASKMNFPKPIGMSGAPLWELRRNEDGGRRVVGVMIESRKLERVFVAADIGFVLKFIRDHFGIK